MLKWYIIFIEERMKDGTETCLKAIRGLDEALAYINSHQQKIYAKNNFSYRLYELGKEIKIEEVEAEIPQPPKKEKIYRQKLT